MNRLLLPLAALLAAVSGCHLSVPAALGDNVAKAQAKGAPILVFAMGTPGQVSAGTKTATPVFVQFLVTDDRTIRRIRFQLAAYSQRGYPVMTPGGKHLGMTLIGPGDFDPGKLYEVNTFNARPLGFPGGRVACVQIQEMTVTYADGQQVHLATPQIEATLVPELQRGCHDRGPAVSDLLSDRSSG